MLDTVLARIQAADFTVLQDLSGLDATTVAPLLTEQDPRARELVLWILDALGGLAATRAAAAAVLDEHPQVVGVALRVLRHHATPEVLEQVLGDYEATPEPAVRRHLALVLGRIGAARSDVLALEQSEPDPDARATLALVVAHLGDSDARTRVPAAWPSLPGRQARSMLEDLEFLEAAWAVPDLAPFLGDLTPVLRIGVDGLPGPEHLRVCDLAVNLAARLGSPPFPFPTDGHTNYADEQLRQTKGYLDGLART
jgi:HEAT repeat protein